MKQELAIVPKQLPTEIPTLPPLPVWDEHLDTYLARAKSFTCLTRNDFDNAKILASDGTKLKNQIVQSYAPLTQAIDALKEPVLERRREDTCKVDAAVKLIDSVATSWKREQDRIAQEKAEEERQAEIRRREEARRAEIRRLEIAQEAKQIKDSEIAEEWGEQAVTLPPVTVPEIIPPRHVQADSGLSYRKGVRIKPKMVVTVTDPDAVNRRFCSPDRIKYEAAAKSYFALIKDATPEQIRKMEEEIGGVSITWE